MINDFDWSGIFKKALSRGGWLAEVFYERTRTAAIQMEERRLEKPTAGVDQGLGLRVLFGQRTAYGYTTELTGGGLLELAGELSLMVEGERNEPSPDLALERAGEGYRILKPPAGEEMAAKVELVRRASERAWSLDKRIRQVKAVYLERQQEIFIANSLGRAVEDHRTGVILLTQVVAEENGVIQTGYEPVGGALGLELFDDHPPEEVAELAGRRAILMLESRPAPGGRMPVVISGRAGGTMVHEAVGHGLEADLALEGLSVYSGRLGEMVASELVSVADDATLPAKRGSFGFDDEGTPAQRTVLIDRGRLTSYMTDRLYARKGELPLSGNGRRESFRHRPVVRMTNTLLLPGSSDPESILKGTDSGLYVVRVGGGQVNTVNGDFVFEVGEGYLIDQGKVGEPVRGATLVGNGPQVLMTIDAVGSDLGFAIGTCGKEGQGVPVADAQPTIRIPELLVGGAV